LYGCECTGLAIALLQRPNLEHAREGAELEGDVNDPKTSSRVQAVVDWCGPIGFVRILNGRALSLGGTNSPVTRLLGGPVAENREKAAKASPITYVSKAASAFLIMRGAQDHSVPFEQSEAFYAALKQAGADVTLLPMKGAGHNFMRQLEAIEAVQELMKRCSK
jgi:dipeptidyl aminopeptidase/acylaminoacyl peptidase